MMKATGRLHEPQGNKSREEADWASQWPSDWPPVRMSCIHPSIGAFEKKAAVERHVALNSVELVVID